MNLKALSILIRNIRIRKEMFPQTAEVKDTYLPK